MKVDVDDALGPLYPAWQVLGQDVLGAGWLFAAKKKTIRIFVLSDSYSTLYRVVALAQQVESGAELERIEARGSGARIAQAVERDVPRLDPGPRLSLEQEVAIEVDVVLVDSA